MLKELVSNEVLIVAVLSWFFAQFTKLITHLVKEKKLDISMMFASGGMPSSHTSTVVGLASIVGLQEGFGSTYFAIACIIAIIVMYDATGVRLAVSKQAVILNHMLKDKKFNFEKLNELVGHTPKQVLGGAILGIAVACIYAFYIQSI